MAFYFKKLTIMDYLGKTNQFPCQNKWVIIDYNGLKWIIFSKIID